jgi:hypothetical protein
MHGKQVLWHAFFFFVVRLIKTNGKEALCRALVAVHSKEIAWERWVFRQGAGLVVCWRSRARSASSSQGGVTSSQRPADRPGLGLRWPQHSWRVVALLSCSGSADAVTKRVQAKSYGCCRPMMTTLYRRRLASSRRRFWLLLHLSLSGELFK